MARLLELIRKSALPSHQMMTAAKGALDAPAAEMVEILVYLAENNKIFGEQSRITLAGWDEKSAKAIAANPATPKEVLDYWISPKNLRPALFPLLLENPAVSLAKIGEIAGTSKGEWIDVMLASPRVQKSHQVLRDLAANNGLTGVQAIRVQELITGKTATVAVQAKIEPAPIVTTSIPMQPNANETLAASDLPAPVETSPAAETDSSDPETEKVLTAFLTEHASEIAAEGDKPFQPIGGILEAITAAEPQAVTAQPQAVAAAAGASSTPAKPAIAVKTAPKKPTNPEDEQRGSVLQKISKLDIKGRIQLGMKGTKEERSILVRDGTKVVALAVLDSPKITDGEVEKFANQKNVLEAVLRAIPMKRRFAKNYIIVRNLVANPRTPLDVSLGLMKNLLVQDLRNLSGNKEVSDTVRKLALRMFKQKLDPGKG
ncbi:MAG TPA: hypothetical protein VHQ22_17935 [Terriglobales bacterium]|jgi:hypothetical protein|nr:hypothetical protein [Terriglobales bacterium]